MGKRTISGTSKSVAPSYIMTSNIAVWFVGGVKSKLHGLGNKTLEKKGKDLKHAMSKYVAPHNTGDGYLCNRSDR